MREIGSMKLAVEDSATGTAGGDAVPVCIKDYARAGNVIPRLDPIFTEHKFNSVWRFRQYKKDGHPVEVETGLLFGRGDA